MPIYYLGHGNLKESKKNEVKEETFQQKECAWQTKVLLKLVNFNFGKKYLGQFQKFCCGIVVFVYMCTKID